MEMTTGRSAITTPASGSEAATTPSSVEGPYRLLFEGKDLQTGPDSFIEACPRLGVINVQWNADGLAGMISAPFPGSGADEQAKYPVDFKDAALKVGRVVLDKTAIDAFKSELAAQQNTATTAETGVSLAQCLVQFHQREQLGSENEWYCPTCKAHVRAFKSLRLWSAPPVLIINLKRFMYETRLGERQRVEKIFDLVTFPLEGLDMTEYLMQSEEGGGEGKVLYDLFAVSNHIGAFGGGHYTAFVKNQQTNTWWLMDDSRVSKVEDPKAQIVSPLAYVLFYQRRA
jgi:uncharacterized UBP type Zn finger protein